MWNTLRKIHITVSILLIQYLIYCVHYVTSIAPGIKDLEMDTQNPSLYRAYNLMWAYSYIKQTLAIIIII